MEHRSEDLSWLQDRVVDFKFHSTNDDMHFLGDEDLAQGGRGAFPVMPDGIVSDYVNPADLHRVQGDIPKHALPMSREAAVAPPLDTGRDDLSAMDEFFRLQGGWRPPIPCSHCKRLRLQCFMLQTTVANPNPITACSSCVALYRHCSLAGPSKRQASTFETPHPVIGQLHGVYEDERVDQVTVSHGRDAAVSAGTTMRASKRSSSRSNTSTRPLRLWFSGHSEDPYPTECDKTQLAYVSGLSRTQIDNWFSNARRRKKQSERATSAASLEIHRQGSPMPQRSTVDMTPLERWQHSPPDAEPAQFADIERALGLASSTSSLNALQEASDYDVWAAPVPDFDSDGMWCSLPDSVDSSSNTTSSCNSRLSYTSSKRSHDGASLEALPPKRRQRSKRSDFHCAECARTFTRKSDLLRHERAFHSHSREVWICSDLILPGESATVWRVSQPAPECVLCGFPNPDEKHNLSHEFVACADRDIAERTFTRKDHLFQHLEKFHRCRRKWDGWRLDGAVDRFRHVENP